MIDELNYRPQGKNSQRKFLFIYFVEDLKEVRLEKVLKRLKLICENQISKIVDY